MSHFVDLPFVLGNGGGHAGQSDQPVILNLTITVSANATSHLIFPINTTPFVIATVPEPLLPPTDCIPTETRTPLPDVWAAMSPVENALHDADEATKTINLPGRWEGAVAGIKWVMDTVSPATEVRHSAMSFYLVLD